jgi:hypothetical protein
MRSTHCLALGLTFGSYAAALVLPAPRRPIRTRHHAAPPLEFVKAVGAHLPVTDDAQTTYVHRDPDVLVLRNFIKKEDCDGLLKAGRAASLEKSPVEYAGWTEDAAELLQTWASGPAAWIALAAVLISVNIFGVDDRIQLAETGLGVYVVNLGLAAVAIFGFLDQRKEKLQALRTSKSVALRGATPAKGEVACYERLLSLLPSITPESCEALTLIKYDPGDALAPHYDANRAADAEDVARGGQTLATLLVYLNDVDDGGCTRFNKLDITVAPRKGDACLFFPADASGQFDERLEHEGEAPRAEKWIGRIWVHARPIIGETGCPPGTLEALRNR